MYQPKSFAPIIKLAENCNYTCAFCRYANHPPTGQSIMSLELCMRIMDEICQYNVEHGEKHASFIFHGGEPLLWGKENFKKIHAYQQELYIRYDGLQIRNGMQSNAFLLDEEWLDILEEMKVNVGISLDGPPEMNFHYGAMGNEQSIDRVVKNIHALGNRKMTNGILSVVTEKHLGHAKEYFDFLNERKITSTGFCYCYNPRDNYSIDPLKLADFLCESFDIYYHTEQKIRVREFDKLLLKLYGQKKQGCVFGERRECGSFISISPNGQVGFCDAYEANTYVIGNIWDQSLNEIVDADVYQKNKELYITGGSN